MTAVLCALPDSCALPAHTLVRPPRSPHPCAPFPPLQAELDGIARHEQPSIEVREQPQLSLHAPSVCARGQPQRPDTPAPHLPRQAVEMLRAEAAALFQSQRMPVGRAAAAAAAAPRVACLRCAGLYVPKSFEPLVAPVRTCRAGLSNIGGAQGPTAAPTPHPPTHLPHLPSFRCC